MCNNFRNYKECKGRSLKKYIEKEKSKIEKLLIQFIIKFYQLKFQIITDNYKQIDNI